MTQRERQILNWIEADPMISQQELAERAGITRSSVAVHISKEVLHWGDTYVIDIVDPADEIMALMLTIAIDAANCSNSN